VRVELRIGELVVDGVAMSGRDIVPFREAIETELTRLIADGGLPSRVTPSASVLETTASPTSRPSSLGNATARVVYGRFHR
jgi:hypothetical protein